MFFFSFSFNSLQLDLDSSKGNISRMWCERQIHMATFLPGNNNSEILEGMARRANLQMSLSKPSLWFGAHHVLLLDFCKTLKKLENIYVSPYWLGYIGQRSSKKYRSLGPLNGPLGSTNNNPMEIFSDAGLSKIYMKLHISIYLMLVNWLDLKTNTSALSGK